jgi:hypothetical protein
MAREPDKTLNSRIAAPAPIAALPAQSKMALVTGLLARPEGASLDDLVAATCWQPHTTRAALTSLRKKGLTIVRGKVDGVTRYTIASALAEKAPSSKRRAGK